MPMTLVAALKRYEPSAFEQLLAQPSTTLYRVALGLLGQPQEAEEVLQETWLRVYKKIHTFREHAALPTWLYRIVVNTALVRLRARTRRSEAPQESAGPAYAVAEACPREGAAWTLPPEEVLLRQEVRTALQRGIDGLPEPYRTVYVLAELEGRPHQELATALGLTVGTVKTRLHRARRLLRGVLVEAGEANGGRSEVDQRARAPRPSVGRQSGVRARRPPPRREPITIRPGRDDRLWRGDLGLFALTPCESYKQNGASKGCQDADS